MKKRITLFLVAFCLILSGCSGSKVNDLVKTVEDNPSAYFEDYDELQYISSEYNSKKDAYYLVYQGKKEKNNVIRTYKLNAHFYISNGEWILHKVDSEIVNQYLNIAGTHWEGRTQSAWKVEKGEDITILSVSDDSSELSINWGGEEIDFEREKDTDEFEYAYLSKSRPEPILIRYSVLDGEARLLLYLDYRPSDLGIMPDMKYTLIE